MLDETTDAAGAYGQAFARRFHMRAAPGTIVSRSLKAGEIAVTELRGDAPPMATNAPIPREDAWLVAVQLRDFPDHHYWEDGRFADRRDLFAGQTLVYDLKRDPRAMLDKPFHSAHVYLPRAALDALADDHDCTRVGELAYRPGAGIDDAAMAAMMAVLAPAFRRPGQANPLFLDHVTHAAALHVAQTYGGMRPRPVARGGLAPWQEKRAVEMLAANLDGALNIRDLAAACRLSASHFARAFRQSLGAPPHQYLLTLRVERAKAMLRDTAASLAEVGLQCGFVDQSHFTRVFTGRTGLPPGAWRRAWAA